MNLILFFAIIFGFLLMCNWIYIFVIKPFIKNKSQEYSDVMGIPDFKYYCPPPTKPTHTTNGLMSVKYTLTRK